MRTSAETPPFRACRGSLTFTVEASGELQTVNAFPWVDQTGALASSAQLDDRVAGGFELLIILWQVDPQVGLMRLGAGDSPAAKKFAAELEALRNPMRTPPGWNYRWETGDAEAFEGTEDGVIHCEITDDAAILQKTVSAPLTPETRLRWSWKVDRLVSEDAEDSLANHDYVSIAAEFDNGQDLTYVWNASFRPGIQLPLSDSVMA
jgi:hypothetical protein